LQTVAVTSGGGGNLSDTPSGGGAVGVETLKGSRENSMGRGVPNSRAEFGTETLLKTVLMHFEAGKAI